MLGSVVNTSSPLYTPLLVNRQHPINRRRLAWWLTVPHLYGGRQWYDLMGLNHATLTSMGNASNGWRPATHRGGYGSLLFDGTAGEVTPPNFLTGSPTEATVSAWLLNTGANSTSFVFSRSRGTFAAGGIDLQAGRVVVQQSDFSAKSTTTQTTNDSKWHHIVGRYSGTGGLSELSFWLDGVKAASIATTTASLVAMTAGQCFIGAGGNGASQTNFFTGNLDDISVWGRALSDWEIVSLYNPSRQNYPGVLNRWGDGLRHITGGGGAATFLAAWALGSNRLIGSGTYVP